MSVLSVPSLRTVRILTALDLHLAPLGVVRVSLQVHGAGQLHQHPELSKGYPQQCLIGILLSLSYLIL